LLEEYQRRGLATEATQELIRWAFSHLSVEMVVASIRMMEKCGMNFLGAGSEEGVIRYGRRRE
jgi:RimJ/RimL family protein N-acetyltransferase